MTSLFFEMNAYDIAARIASEGRVPLVPLVHPHELREGGEVLVDENVRVTSAIVDHPLTVPAFAYRFDARDRSIVISGDTSPSNSVATLARGADVLVHPPDDPTVTNAMWMEAARRCFRGTVVIGHDLLEI